MEIILFVFLSVSYNLQGFGQGIYFASLNMAECG